ncbi:hypothetical protein R3P38DRAFT_3241886 [Favolaschia claudopus]|uniref:Uncharacterized protein n=1 Tax=Favolaschia claudopus TaxID=2862362 RepID=A0AAV9Z5C9_9AGAR
MTAHPTPSQPSPSSAAMSTELQELVVLVAQLSAATTDAMRLTMEVQARLPVVIAAEAAAAARSATASLVPVGTPSAPIVLPVSSAAPAAPSSLPVPSAAASPPIPSPEPAQVDHTGPLFVRGIPQTPAEVERTHPPGSGETWYVVIRGREPGLYGTALDADHQCNGIPRQYKIKKTTRADALLLYRSLYNGPHGEGVEKWNEVEED